MISRYGRALSSVSARVQFESHRHVARRAFTTHATPVWQTIRSHPWTPLKVAGAAGAVGLGALVAVGLMQPANYVPSSARAQIRAYSGPEFASMVRNRMMKTYGYVSAGLGITALSAVTLFSRGYAARLAMYPIAGALGCMALTIGCMIAVQAIPQENVVPKHLAWVGFNGAMGFSLCPIVALGGVVLQQAAVVTGVIVGSLSAVAAVAPDGQFLSWGPYLGCGLGVMVAASIGSMFFPGSAMLQNVVLYGGLGLFGMYTCYDTQKMLYHAELDSSYDPINRGIGLYMDTINIFIRVAQIIAMNGRRK